mgnify:CR=1 FL=1|jgi:uncharacterized SAM-binding protein YcdF (DUF218 family)
MIFFRIISFILLCWIAGFIWFLYQFESTNINDLKKSDAIIVLTGSQGRIDAGINLLLENKAPILFISGVGKKSKLKDLSKYLISYNHKQLKPLESSIYLGHFASTTKENAIETAQWITKHNCKKIILVTSDYHMQRSLLWLKEYMPNVEITPFQVVKNIDNKDQSWKNIPSLKLIILEYNKLIFSYFIGNLLYDY